MSENQTIKDRVESIMYGGQAGPAMRMALFVLSFIYGLGVSLRLFLFSIKVLGVKRLECPVISVGNITVGGTGKTPLTIFLARLAAASGKRAVIISRGYKRSTEGLKLVSDSSGILLSAKEAGDEPYLMAESLKGTPVVVCADRAQAGRFAIDRFSPDVIILDDGFQHIRCFRDVNIALVDGTAGFGNGRLVPAGPLREPVGGLKRADILMIKGMGIDDLSLDDRAIVRGLGKPVFAFEYEPVSLAELNGEKALAPEFLRGKRVAALAGIADNSAFIRTLRGLGARVEKTIERPDHHSYDGSDAAETVKIADGVDLIVTTAKDAVKLKPIDSIKALPIYVLNVEAVVKDKKGFIDAIRRINAGVI